MYGRRPAVRRLLNTLFVMSEESYLSLDGENIVVQGAGEKIARFPLHALEGIVYFGYKGASPALMGACAKRKINLSFLTPRGKFLCRVSGENQGNVLLRKKQYRSSEDIEESVRLARSFLLGKLFNARWSLERAARDYPLRIEAERVKHVSSQLADSISSIERMSTLEELRGLEGDAATQYFSVLDELILQNKDSFYYRGRSRRPPLDNLNAMLSFAYMLLASDCAAALEAVGLDAYVGFFHRDRPGRASLALDLMEELRPLFADRLVISSINNRVIRKEHFEQGENGAVWLNEDGRKTFLGAYQDRKKEVIQHPYLKEKTPWGLIPYIQALLLSRYLRGDLDGYPPFLWK